MHYYPRLFSIVLCSLFFLQNSSANTIDSQSLEQQANTNIQNMYRSLRSMKRLSMSERIDWFSEHFKDSRYILGSLGEGSHARYDQYPSYRIDAFDCDTYVNTVVALALANSLQGFQHCMKLLRYKNGTVCYIKRNHFTSIDWNANNQQRGILKDITTSIVDQQNKPVAQSVTTLINKPNWYAHKTLKDIRLITESDVEQNKRLQELKAQGQKLKTKSYTLAYLPLDRLFNQEKSNDYLLSQIPNAAIIEIVRPHWDLRQQIGTFLDISHLGFAIWKDGTLYFRQASSQYGKVVDTPLAAYLIAAHKTSPTIKGINIQIVVSQPPVNQRCK